SPHLTDVRIRLEQVATLEQPLAMAVREGDSALYVAQKTGKVVAIRAARTVDKVPVLDLSDEVSLGGEQGLLGLAFAPGGRELYVNYTDTNGDTHVTGFAMRGDRADPATRRDILVVEQPYSNHNGGNLVFGPDGFLYIGLGDGGSGGDPLGNGQSLSTLLGKMLRIDPQLSGESPFRIPTDNPFVGRGDARPAIWAYGLRNPWRYSFDRLTGDLWIGDVGQTEWEEVDVQPAGSSGGENYGWNILEGSHPSFGDELPDGVAPTYEYSHAEGGCTVIGGYVYRGEAIPALFGAYLFGDLCIGEIEALRVENGRVTGHSILGPVVENLSSFGEDADGELYAMSLSGGVYRIAAGS
ncbi:MAG TPA: PQQ-dependent sugar dehydrogenase, partial [Actinomycetota bacterium]|nr:PQQ-dependent sugar dehydrogenase [Actinomycetota bacterium]